MPKSTPVTLCFIMAVGSNGTQVHCGGGGGGGGGGNPTPASPSISSFVVNPATVRVGGNAQLTAFFANGSGVITPGNLSATSGTPLTISPTATTSYVLTVTNSAGVSVTQTTGVTVVPVGMAVNSPNSVQASGVQQTTANGTFSNGPVLGEPVPATSTSTPSSSIQVRNDFLPPVPGSAN